MATQTIKTTFKFKRGLASDWTSQNPILAEGEPGFELDTYQLKIGDGVTAWNDLKYFGNGTLSEKAIQFRGVVNSLDEITNPVKGELILLDTAEYIYDGSKWVLIGDEGVYATQEKVEEIKSTLESQIHSNFIEALTEEEVKAICV